MPIFIGTNTDDDLTGTDEPDTIAGRDGDDTIRDGDGGPDELVGGRGNDTYYVTSALNTIWENPGEGIDTVRTAVIRFVLAANLENLYFTGGAAAFAGYGNAGDNVIVGGGGNDILYGYDGRDTLAGGDGDDYLDGGTGLANTLIGGLGNDTYIVGTTGDTIVENAGEGTDTVRAAVAVYTLAANLENLSYSGAGNFTGYGNAGDNVIIGGAGNDFLWGGAGRDVIAGGVGDDTIDGGTGAANQLQGGTGNDIFIVGAVGDSIVEFAGEGIDTVRTALAAYTLAPNVENLTYTGADSFTGNGNALDNVIIGGSGNDTLSGFEGRDVIAGGAGDDWIDGGSGVANQLQGGSGNDTYVVRASGDSIVEFIDEGIDTVRTALASFILAANIENLSYTGSVAFTGTGNALANRITGGIGEDTLSGGAGDDTLDGGAGARNTLIGGAGNDTYVVSAAGDIVIEGADGGYDVIVTTLANFVRPENVEEVISLTPGAIYGDGQTNFISGSSGNDRIYGLAGDDILWGGGGVDRLEGGPGNDQLYLGIAVPPFVVGDFRYGGSAEDVMIGGDGDDFYRFDSGPPTIIETANGGYDRIQTGFTGTYVMPQNVEEIRGITIYIPLPDTRVIGPSTIIGNAQNNVIYSNDRDPLLFGMDGDDTFYAAAFGETMIGGNGNDVFYTLSTTIRYYGGETGIDRIIGLPRDIVLHQGNFAPTDVVSFVRGPGAFATGSNSTIIHDTSNGLVSYDRDGAGPGAAIPLFYYNDMLTRDDFTFAFF
jgi:Ca2+-binding RTX toxin-like protein